MVYRFANYQTPQNSFNISARFWKTLTTAQQQTHPNSRVLACKKQISTTPKKTGPSQPSGALERQFLGELRFECFMNFIMVGCKMMNVTMNSNVS